MGSYGPSSRDDRDCALVWGIQAGILAALSLGFHKTHIETDNKEVFDTMRVQEYIFLPPDLEEAFFQFNALFANRYKEAETFRKVSIIPVELNATAQYIATFGIENMIALIILWESAAFFRARHWNDPYTPPVRATGKFWGRGSNRPMVTGSPS